MPIFAWGSNGAGQLGLGHKDDTAIPSQCLKKYNIGIPQSLSAGGNHTIILYESPPGVLLSAGDVPGLSEECSRDIALCSATWTASVLCTTTSQTILTAGIGERGELGCGEEVKDNLEFKSLDLNGLCTGNEHIVQLSSSIQHTIAVLSNGDVLGWGNGRKGQLGEPAEIVFQPRKIAGIDFPVRKAACGQNFTLLAGDPKLGQFLILGQDKFGVRSSAPDSIAGWKDIGVSWGSVFVLFEDGILSSWGRDDHGQLVGSSLKSIAKIAIGSEHALALTESNKLYAWGWGEHGNCGTETDDSGDAKIPRRIPIPAAAGQIKGIGAGCATSWFWT